MSVVNKMLQDLEARQAQHEGVSADYLPPKKVRPNWLVIALLIAAIVAITIGATTGHTWFEQDTAPAADFKVVSQTPEQPKKKKMLVEPVKKAEPVMTEQVTSSMTSVAPPQTKEKISANATLDMSMPALEDAYEAQDIKLASEIQSESQTQSSTVEALQQDTSHFIMNDSSVQNQTRSLKQRIAESLSNDDLPLAKTLLLELLEKEPENLNARKRLASLFFAQGYYEQSQHLLNQGINQQPQQADLRLMLARLHMAQKSPTKAMEVLEGLQPNPQQPDEHVIEYLAYRAALAQQLSKSRVAQSDYATLTDIDPIIAKWWLGLGIAQDQLGESTLALRAYRKANILNQLDEPVSAFVQQRIQILAGSQ